MLKEKPAMIESEFSKRLEPVGRILQNDEYHVWGCAPMYAEDGKVHVFYSRWKPKYKRCGWVGACEIGHAIADSPESPFVHVDVALKGEGGDFWDGWSIHNPSVYKVDGKYILLFMGSSGRYLDKTIDEIADMPEEEHLENYHYLVSQKRVGMAVADDLNGPWTRVSLNEPMIDVNPGDDCWDSFCTSNPAFVKTPEGKYRIYFKAWSRTSAQKISGNRMYGFAESDNLEGPYVKYENNPVIDFSIYGERVQTEDGFIWQEDGMYHMVLRDMGVFNHQYGLYTSSKDGIEWAEPQVGYWGGSHYFGEDVYKGEILENRFERAQILLKDGKADYLFLSYRGGEGKLSSGVVFKIK
ncbi:MAG: glycoside hydrolase family protein [Clostridia bacterium]